MEEGEEKEELCNKLKCNGRENWEESFLPVLGAVTCMY